MASPREIEEKLRLLQLKQTRFASCYPQFNPLDAFRTHIANTVADILDVDAATAYSALQRTKTLEKGDLTLAIPALKVKGSKPEDLVTKLVEQVRKPTVHSP